VMCVFSRAAPRHTTKYRGEHEARFWTRDPGLETEPIRRGRRRPLEKTHKEEK
jgi:hypothetical protein